MHLFEIKLLKNVMGISLAIIVGVPLFYFAIIYPSYCRLETRNRESEAIRTAQHLRSLAVRSLAASGATGREMLAVSQDLKNEILLIKGDFKLNKVRILSESGQVIFSTDSEEAGLKKGKKYFFDIVAGGRVYSETLRRKLSSPGKRTADSHLVVACVPFMNGEHFVGAVEIYYDVTASWEQQRGLFWQSFLYLFAFVCGLFILNILLAVNASKTIRAQRRAEEALQESEHKNRQIVENATQGIVVARDGRIKFLNRKTQEIAGHSVEELMSRPFIDFVHPADRETVIQRHRRRMEGEDVSNLYQMRIIDKHGHQKWTEVNTIRIDWEGKLAVLSFLNDVTARKQAEDALRENEEYLRTVMKTIHTGVLIVDPRTRKIVDANPHAAAMFGCEVYELLGRDYHSHMCMQAMGLCPREQPCGEVEGADCVLRTVHGNAIQVRRSAAGAKAKGHDYVVQSLQDITDIQALLRKQEINMELAKNILGVVNKAPPRYTRLAHDLSLFVDVIFLPCYAIGGDHFLVRSHAAGRSKGHAKTVISLKDQSGHEVGCVLRSILTDLIHNAILNNESGLTLEETAARLNDEICGLQLFKEDEFFTSIDAELDHETLELNYMSCGHPPFFLIRGREIIEFPEPHGAGSNLPMAVLPETTYSAGKCRLEAGDKLIFYTDGLSEMTFKKRKKIIARREMRQIIGAIIERFGQRPVSEIVHALLAEISGQSGEAVAAHGGLNGPQNSSGDDVTILGLEIEDRSRCRQQVWRPRDHEQMCLLVEQLYAALQREWLLHGYGSPELRLRTACEETLLNAWKHGNRQDPRKAVTVRWRWGNDFHLEVLDEGAGFDYDNIPDPTAPENITKVSGRGIFLVRRLAESVVWQDKGRCIVMSFKKEGKPAGNQPTAHSAGPPPAGAACGLQ